MSPFDCGGLLYTYVNFFKNDSFSGRVTVGDLYGIIAFANPFGGYGVAYPIFLHRTVRQGMAVHCDRSSGDRPGFNIDAERNIAARGD